MASLWKQSDSGVSMCSTWRRWRRWNQLSSFRLPMHSWSFGSCPKGLGNPFKMHRDGDRSLQLLIFNEEFLVSTSHQCMRIRPGIGPCKSAPGGCMFKERLVKMVVAKPPAWFHWSSRLRFLNSLPLGLWEKETDHGAAPIKPPIWYTSFPTSF